MLLTHCKSIVVDVYVEFDAEGRDGTKKMKMGRLVLALDLGSKHLQGEMKLGRP